MIVVSFLFVNFLFYYCHCFLDRTEINYGPYRNSVPLFSIGFRLYIRLCTGATGHPLRVWRMRSTSPGGLGTRLLSVVYGPISIPHQWFLFQSAPIVIPDTFVSTLPFRSSVQYLSHGDKAPERGLVSALDSSLPVGRFQTSLPVEDSNAL